MPRAAPITTRPRSSPPIRPLMSVWRQEEGCRRNEKVFVDIFLIFIVTTPVRADWLLFNDNDEGSFYYDSQTIRGTNLRRVLLRLEYKSAQNGIRSVRSYEELDCNEGTKRILTISFFSESNLSGSIIGTRDQPGAFRYIAPGSVGAKLFPLVCGKNL